MLASTPWPHLNAVSSLETLIPGTVTLRFGRLQHMNGGTEQIKDKPQEDRPGPQEGAGGGGWAAFPGTEAVSRALAGRGQTCSAVGGLTFEFSASSSGHPLPVSRCLCTNRPPLGYDLDQGPGSRGLRVSGLGTAITWGLGGCWLCAGGGGRPEALVAGLTPLTKPSHWVLTLRKFQMLKVREGSNLKWGDL